MYDPSQLSIKNRNLGVHAVDVGNINGRIDTLKSVPVYGIVFSLIEGNTFSLSKDTNLISLA